MRKGEHFIVISHHGTRHPVGTEVEVIHINQSQRDSRPILARAVGGQTEYWYAFSDLQSVEEWKYENRS